MTRYAKIFPWALVGLCALYVASKSYPRAETHKEFDLSAFGRLPVLDGGRVKPLDSVARNNLLLISGRSDWVDENGDTQPAIRWLIDVMAADDPHTGPAADYKVFRVDNEQVVNYLGLPDRPGLRYSLNELRKSWEKLVGAYEKAKGIDEKKRDLFHAKILELARRLKAYEDLARRRTPTVVPSKPGSEEWVSLADVDDPIARSYAPAIQARAEERVDAALRAKGQDPANLGTAEKRGRDRAVAAVAAEELEQIIEAERKSANPAAAAFARILKAYRNNESQKGYPQAIEEYRTKHVYPLHPSFRDTVEAEWAFNQAAPFINAAFLYVLAGVLMALSWLGWTEPFRKAAIGVAVLALGVHVLGLIGRMYLMDRPLVFVTNLYSSALMIGAGAVAFCLFVEWLFRNGVGLVVGTTLGAATVKIAHHLTLDGSDTLGTLVAVLDTNFWLASHVTTITLGYAATYVAGLMGVVYIVWGLFFTTLTKDKHLALGKMIYGVTCFATLLSFVGTVLGGIWADQSWGRFWGWDPKENGAVLIVIWNALILHARWGGMVKQRGLAVLAVGGIMVTTWSWFGTNQLGVGLHNYGFNKSLAEGCKYTWIVSMAVIVGGLIPLHYWRSFGPPLIGTAAPPAPEPVAPPPAPPPVPAPQPPVSEQNGHAPKKTGKKGGKRR